MSYGESDSASTRGQGLQQLVAVVVTEGVVDVLEAVEVHNGHRCRLAVPASVVDRLRRPADKEGPVGQPGQDVTLGQEGVALRSPAQAAADRGGDQEQGQVEQAQANRQDQIEAVQPGGDVLADRRVGQVDLEDPERCRVRLDPQLKIDLHGFDAAFAGVATIGVETGQAEDGFTLGRIERFVLRRTAEARAIVGEHHVSGQVTNAKPQYVAVGDGLGHHVVEADVLVGVEALGEGVAVQLRLDGGLRDQAGLGVPVGQAPLLRLPPVAPCQHPAEEEHRDQADRSVGREHAPQRPRCFVAGVHVHLSTNAPIT